MSRLDSPTTRQYHPSDEREIGTKVN
ncbi:hypothetical protein EMIT0P43_40342 [Pseudomonas jessenii]